MAMCRGEAAPTRATEGPRAATPTGFAKPAALPLANILPRSFDEIVKSASTTAGIANAEAATSKIAAR